MKKFYNFMAVALVAMLTLTLTSCNDDDIAKTLDGIWEGEVSQNYSWRWSNYNNYQYVDIEFYKDPYRFSNGSGIEYDYDRYGRYTSCRFDFSVDFGVIYMDYEDGTRVRISNYDLTNTRFRGEFRDYRTGAYLADFNFVKVAEHRYNRYNYSYSEELQFEEDVPENKGSQTEETK